MPKFADVNNLYLDDIPMDLQGLSPLEKDLVALIHPVQHRHVVTDKRGQRNVATAKRGITTFLLSPLDSILDTIFDHMSTDINQNIDRLLIRITASGKDKTYNKLYIFRIQ